MPEIEGYNYIQRKNKRFLPATWKILYVCISFYLLSCSTGQNIRTPVEIYLSPAAVKTPEDSSSKTHTYDFIHDLISIQKNPDSLQVNSEVKNITIEIDSSFLSRFPVLNILLSDQVPTDSADFTILLKTFTVKPNEIVWIHSSDSDSVLISPDSRIPIVLRNEVLARVDFYLNRKKSALLSIRSKVKRYKHTFQKILSEYGVPVELFYLAIVESNLNESARSRMEAKGIWQFLSGTARNFGLTVTECIDERLDPIKSTHAAARYLKYLYEVFGDWYLAISAYNAGQTNVISAIKKNNTLNFWKLEELPRETKNYLPSFLAVLYIFEYVPEFRIEELDRKIWDCITITIRKPTTIETIAQKFNLPQERIKRINPALKCNIIPSGVLPYHLRIPVYKK